jgi:hypothetical protein
LSIHDIAGNKIKSKAITGLITRIGIDGLPSGTYIWHLFKQSRIIETGKFIKTD